MIIITLIIISLSLFFCYLREKAPLNLIKMANEEKRSKGGKGFKVNLIKDPAQEMGLVTAPAGSIRVLGPGTTAQNKSLGNLLLLHLKKLVVPMLIRKQKGDDFFLIKIKTFPACRIVKKCLTNLGL